ncbi:MAG: SDR family oxidoreductase [Deltaproteobacteria bacterium]|nr:SDR family oxidoreductase [Deltaproteobacteria bacterium]
MIRCLITGGAGFIGSHLVDEAVRRGWRVVVLDNFSTGHMENLTSSLDHIDLVRGDVRDQELLRQCFRGVDVVFHHAALVAVPDSVANPILSAEINDLGTLNVFLAARDAGVKRVVYASSSAVYGNISTPPHDETMKPCPDSPYAAHKLLGEHYAAIFQNLYGLDIVSLRYFNVYGPRQDPSSPYSGVISIFLEKARRGLAPVIFGDGGQRRDFIYVSDVVAANYLAALTKINSRPIYNIGTGRAVTLLDMIKNLEELTGHDLNPQFEQPRPGDVYASWAMVDRAKEDLGFKSQVSFKSGLAKTWTWLDGLEQ